MRDTNSLNKVILIGRLGKKPEMRYLPQKERQVARFTMATNERFFNKATRETKDRTEWHNIVVWGNQAAFCEKYLDKGRQVVVEGKLRTRSWQDKEGNKRTTTEIEAENIVLLGRREEYGAGAETSDIESRGPSQAEPEAEGPPFDDSSGGGSGGGGDDDVPF
jgi:single-strand DNA-binding protein